MILARFFILLIVVALCGGGYLLFKTAHIRRLNHVPRNGDRPSLIFFSSQSCQTCPAQARYIERLPDRLVQGLEFRKIDATSEPEMAGRYGVFTLPTTIVVDRSGAIRDVNYGLTHVDHLRRQIEQVI